MPVKFFPSGGRSGMSVCVLLVGSLVMSTSALAERGRGRARGEARRDDVSGQRDQRQNEREAQRQDKVSAKKKKADPGINKRQRRQGSRIVGGVKSGQLTETEMQSLSAQEAALRDLEASAKADGAVSKDERQSLHSALNDLSKSIRSEKHDADTTTPLRLRERDDDLAMSAEARRLAAVRRQLNGKDLSAEQRAALEAEHTSLVDGLYEEAFDDD